VCQAQLPPIAATLDEVLLINLKIGSSLQESVLYEENSSKVDSVLFWKTNRTHKIQFLFKMVRCQLLWQAVQ